MVAGKVLVPINSVRTKGELCQVGAPKEASGELKAQRPEPTR
jgi:hypothetical protein